MAVSCVLEKVTYAIMLLMESGVACKVKPSTDQRLRAR